MDIAAEKPSSAAIQSSGQGSRSSSRMTSRKSNGNRERGIAAGQDKLFYFVGLFSMA
jgi:hypothetical protein